MKKKFRLLVGTYALAGEGPKLGKIHKAGTDSEIVEVDEGRDLRIEFPNKFVLVDAEVAAAGVDPAELEEFRAWKAQREAVAKEAEATEETPEPKKARGKKEAKEPVSSSLGQDVTDSFPTATEAAMLVFVQDDMYFVTETDDPNRAINEAPLGKSQVKKFIAKALTE